MMITLSSIRREIHALPELRIPAQKTVLILKAVAAITASGGCESCLRFMAAPDRPRHLGRMELLGLTTRWMDHHDPAGPADKGPRERPRPSLVSVEPFRRAVRSPLRPVQHNVAGHMGGSRSGV